MSSELSGCIPSKVPYILNVGCVEVQSIESSFYVVNEESKIVRASKFSKVYNR